jgi:transposase
VRQWPCWPRCNAAGPVSSHLFVFRGRWDELIKELRWEGQGLCLLSKRLKKFRFVSSEVDGRVVTTSAQLPLLLQGIDWRMPRRTWRPSSAA